MFGSYSFHVWWGISFLILLIFAWVVGRQSEKGSILIDSRGRYSLTHFQLVLWTLVILSSMLGVLISKGFSPDSFQFPPELLGLMGISAGSGVLATGVKGIKDTSNAAVRRGNPKISQIWLEEEGVLADKVISITKFQNFIFTLVILVFYIATACKTGGLPELPEKIIWLIGISHAGYVGGKVPNKK